MTISESATPRQVANGLCLAPFSRHLVLRYLCGLSRASYSPAVLAPSLPSLFLSLSPPSEIRQLQLQCDPEATGSISFQGFVKMMAYRLKDTNAREECIEAFKVFDPRGTGVVSIDKLSLIFTKMGDKVSKEEAEQLIALAREEDNGYQNDGEVSDSVNYITFVQELFGGN